MKENTELFGLADFRFGSAVQLSAYGRTFFLDKKLVVAKSRKFYNLFIENPNYHNKLPYTLSEEMPGNLEIFEIVMRFCYGFEVKFSSENVVPVVCLAYYLDMTDEHCPNNLLSLGIDYFNQNVLPHWKDSVKALGSTVEVMEVAMQVGIIRVCLDSIVQKACANPHLLGEPIRSNTFDVNVSNRVSARRQLFLIDWQSEDLTALSLQIFEMLISKLFEGGIRSDYIAALLYRYSKKWTNVEVEGVSEIYKRKIIETVEKLLPIEIGVLPCKLLVEMLQTAVLFGSNADCMSGLEDRIGKQLLEATAEDLLIPFQGYATEIQYDIESVKRILKPFYMNYTSPDQSGLIKIADLIDEFIAVVAMEEEMSKEMFMSLLNMSKAATVSLDRSSDLMYRAIDVYLGKHKHLTESEKEEVCQLLDCKSLSQTAYTHAALNERLPIRLVVQTLFVGQLQLRDAISQRIDESEMGNEMVAVGDVENDVDEEETKMEMEKIDNRVMELEKECLLMRKHMEGGSNGLKEKKKGVWKKLKRKFGCISSSVTEDCDCQVKKKIHPRNYF